MLHDGFVTPQTMKIRLNPTPLLKVEAAPPFCKGR